VSDVRRPALALLLGCLLLVAGASALDGYDYYQTIEYAACDQEIYQQDIVIHRSTGTAYNETAGGLETWHIYVGEHCREDYGDVRFTNSTGELEYYLWPDYDSSSARFAVRLDPADRGGVLAVHYGNLSAATTSNGGATYWFFDDYSDPATLANYTELYYATWSRLQYKEIANGRLHLGWGGSGYGSALLYADCPLSSGQFRVEAMFQATGSVSYYRQQKEIGLTTPTTPTYDSTGSSAADFSGFGGTVIAMPGDGGQTAPAGSTGHAEYTLDSTTRYPGIWIQDVSSTTLRSEIWIDHILVRAYSAAPPAASTFSGEQEATGTLHAFPGLTRIPRDLTGNGLYTDINGNNRLDYNDLTIFFQHLAWAKTAQPTSCFDFNGNGWLDYNDVITLFSIITEEHT